MILDDRSGRILAVNQTAARIFGLDEKALIDKKLTDLFDVKTSRDAAGLKKNLRIYGSVFTRSYLHPDGPKRFLDLTAAILPWGGGKTILVTARDVTQRKAAEARVQHLLAQVTKSHDDFLSILNMLNLGIVALDKDGRISFINRIAQQLIGRRKRSILEKKWSRATFYRRLDEYGIKPSK